MAIVIRTKLKNWAGDYKIHKVYKGYKLGEPEFQKKAIEFDQYLKNELDRIGKEVYSEGYLKIGGKKDANCHYWVGKNLKNIINDDTVHILDRRWILESIQFHAGEKSPIYHKNRKKRIAYKYDIFLSEIPFEYINLLNWGEWCTVFDTTAFHTDDRAMQWLKENLEKFKIFKNKRKAIRRLFPPLNAGFCKANRDLNCLTDEEFMTEINDIFDNFLKENEGI